jgi:TatD DNase family protein
VAATREAAGINVETAARWIDGYRRIKAPKEARRFVVSFLVMYVDSHAHIEMADFDGDRDDVVRRALDAGVDIIVDVGNGDIGHDSHSAAFRVAEQYPFIYTTVGVHPHEASLLDSSLYARLAEMSHHEKVIAVGEIGLDYYYDHSPREVQCLAFRQQVQLARARNLPIVIHTRDAEPDTLLILREEWVGSSRPGIIHCFTGTRAFAEDVIQLGFYISFSGVVTFKKAEDLRNTAKAVPVDRLLIETDSPFLTPEPYRGKRNEPAFVVQTAKRIASLRGIEPEELGRITSENFANAFGLSRGLPGNGDRTDSR